MKYAYNTNIGKVREKNEDSALVVENDAGDVLMMVFDGMGGHNQGDIASAQAQTFMTKSFKQKKKFSNRFDMKHWLKKSIKKTNECLNKYTETDPMTKGMGATMACYLIHEDKVLMGYIGDTRAYLIYDGGIKQTSTDETYVQFLYESGKITKEEMATHPSRHVVTNALGCYPNVIINVEFVKDKFDYLLLCSDGLYNMVENHKICSIVEKNGDEIDVAVSKLINTANDNGGNDNIAIALYRKGE